MLTGEPSTGLSIAFGGEGDDEIEDIAVDDQGNIFLVGEFEGTVDFDSGAGILEATSHGLRDVFVQKMRADGEVEWMRTFGGPSLETVKGVGVDDFGFVYVAGNFRGDVDLDPGLGVSLQSAPFGGGYVVKLDSNGEFQWAKSAVASDSSSIEFHDLAVANDGTVHIAGFLEGRVDLDPSEATFELLGKIHSDAFALKLNSHGGFMWAKSNEGNNTGAAFGIAVDDVGNVYTTGYFSTETDFDPGPDSFLVENRKTSLNPFVQKLDRNGDFVWVAPLIGDSYGVGNSIEVDRLQNVYVAGTFRWTYDFDPGVGKQIHFSPSAREDAFILKLDAFGAFEWAAQVGGKEVDVGLDVAVDEWGNVFATGGFKESVDFDPGPGVHELQSAGDYDVFVQSLEPNGRLRWAHRIGQGDRDVGNAIAVSARGRVYVAGGLGGSVSSGDFGEYVIVDADGDDAFLLEFPQDDPPSAFGDVYGAIAGGELAIEASKGVLANDREFQHRKISAVLVSGPTHGELSLHADGAFAYTPVPSFLGVDEFIYQVLADGIAGDTAVVSIYVAEKHDFASTTGSARLFRDDVGAVVSAELSFDREWPCRTTSGFPA